MFRIRFVTPTITNEEGWRHAGGILEIESVRLPFLVDLTHWAMTDYERQWKAGLRRIVDGAPSSALVTSYAGPGDEPHVMWALWRDEEHVYVQERSVLPATLAEPFAPNDPYAHVGARMPSSGYGPPIPQWRVELVPFLAGALGICWPRAFR